MKYLKMLGLAVVAAMALSAFLGAGSASATVLCKTYVTPCPAAWDYPAGTEIDASLAKGSSAVLSSTSGTVLNTCTDSTFKGKTTNTGGAAETVDGNVESMTFANCSSSIAVLALGKFEIHYVGPKTSGALTFIGSKATMLTFGVDCIYGTGSGTQVGVMTSEEGMENAEADVEAILAREEGSLLCPNTISWKAKYVITTPKPLYFKEKTA